MAKAEETREEVVTTAEKTGKKKAAAAPPTVDPGFQALQSLRKSISNKLKVNQVKINLGQYPYIPSGSRVMDDLIGGGKTLDGKTSICPGYPRSRITELFGPEASGKTTAALHAIAQAQKLGGTVCFLDYEQALDHNYATRLGVSFDEKNLLYYRPTTFEEGHSIIRACILAGVDLVVVDSVAAMMPASEIEKAATDEEKIGSVSKPLTRLLREATLLMGADPTKPLPGKLAKRDNGRGGTALVFVNQLRDTIGAKVKMSHTPGGQALKFYSSLRLSYTKLFEVTAAITNAVTGEASKAAYGTKTKVKVVKDKMDAKNGHSATIFIRYGYGIDDVLSLIESAEAHKLVSKNGSHYKYEGTDFHGIEKFRRWLLDNPSVMHALEDRLSGMIHATAQGGEQLEEDTGEESDCFFPESDSELLLGGECSE